MSSTCCCCAHLQLYIDIKIVGVALTRESLIASLVCWCLGITNHILIFHCHIDTTPDNFFPYSNLRSTNAKFCFSHSWWKIIIVFYCTKALQCPVLKFYIILLKKLLENNSSKIPVCTIWDKLTCNHANNWVMLFLLNQKIY